MLRKCLVLVGAIALGLPFALRAQQPPAASWGSTAAQSAADVAADLPADAERGRARASENCVGCHGENGRSSTSAIPSLAGQPAPFIVMQMVLFRNDMRDTPPMPDLARDLSEQEIEDIAAFFAALPAAAPDDRGPRNEALFRRGEAAAQRLGCARCHYGDYVGRNQVPRVAQQREDYLGTVLTQYRTGERTGYDIAMNAVLQNASDDDIAALSHYLAHLD